MPSLAVNLITYAGWAFITVVPFVLLAIVIAMVVFLIFYLRNKEEPDQMKEMYEEMVAEALNSPPEHMKDLYRLDVPNLQELRSNPSLTPETIHKFLRKFEGNKQGIHYGRVVGFNTFDLLATLDDLTMSETLNKEQAETAKSILQTVGTRIHLIVYEKSRGWFRKTRQGIFCFDHQLIGLDSSDGIVTFLGAGTQRLAVYFQTPSGYPEMIDVVRTHLVSLSRIRTAMMLESNIIEFVLNAVNFDTTALKTIELYSATRPTTASGSQQKQG